MHQMNRYIIRIRNYETAPTNVVYLKHNFYWLRKFISLYSIKSETKPKTKWTSHFFRLLIFGKVRALTFNQSSSEINTTQTKWQKRNQSKAICLLIK